MNRDGETAGACGLVVQEGQRAAELGYWIGAPHRGRGYATAAAREAVRFAFAEAGLDRVFALPLAENVASRRVLERVGAPARRAPTRRGAMGRVRSRRCTR